jgi:hypothetical protein
MRNYKTIKKFLVLAKEFKNLYPSEYEIFMMNENNKSTDWYRAQVAALKAKNKSKLNYQIAFKRITDNRSIKCRTKAGRYYES